MVKVPYHIVPWLGGRMHFTDGVRLRTRQTIIAAVEQSVVKLVKQDVVDDILMCGGGFFMLGQITSDH